MVTYHVNNVSSSNISIRKKCDSREWIHLLEDHVGEYLHGEVEQPDLAPVAPGPLQGGGGGGHAEGLHCGTVPGTQQENIITT